MTARALTIRQPWAQLLALGIKTIETRPRRTTYRGRILIHAGQARAQTATLGRIDVFRRGSAPDQILIPGKLRSDLPTITLWSEPDPRPSVVYDAVERGTWVDLPLGAVVGSAVLTDCLPIVDWDMEWPFGRCVAGREGALHLYDFDSDAPLQVSPQWTIAADVTDQLPFGDFRPGRWAWLLEDAQPCETRCPRCWGDGFVVGGEIDPLEIGVDCPTCKGAESCGPVPMRGQQATPWTVTW